MVGLQIREGRVRMSERRLDEVLIDSDDGGEGVKVSNEVKIQG